MRPFVWGGLLLLVIVAFAWSPTVVTEVRPLPEADAGRTVRVSTTSGRGTSAIVKRSTRPNRSTRGDDPQRVIHEWKIKGPLRLSDKEAMENAVDTARNQVTHDLRLSQPPAREFIKEKLMKNFTEKREKDFIEGADAVRYDLDLVLTRGVYHEMVEAERATRVTNRMEGVARVLAIAVAALAAIAGYIRLDEFSKGYYTGRLRFLAVAFVAAAVVFISRAPL